MPTNQPIVLLRERDGGRYLPIWIGARRGRRDHVCAAGRGPAAPLTHDLMRDILAALGHELTEVRIVALRDSVFHAALDHRRQDRDQLAASDAIASPCAPAPRCSSSRAILDEAAIVVSSDEDDEVERFKEFLDHVSAEDFERPDEPRTVRPQGRGRAGLDLNLKTRTWRRHAARRGLTVPPGILPSK